MLLPSGESEIVHGMLQTFDLSQPSTSFSLASVRRPCFRYRCIYVLIIELAAPSASLPHANNETRVCTPHTQGESQMSMEDTRFVGLASFLGTIASISSDEHRMAICTTADTLHHLPLYNLCPIFGNA